MSKARTHSHEATIKLFLAGDVMLGRGIDQMLPKPCDPRLYETYSSSALDYVRLAERRTGQLARPVSLDYIWGDGIAELARQRPDIRLVNLETAITRSDAAEPKGINYRMSPENTGVLTAANIQVCVLANNHVMDWGVPGLLDTLHALRSAGIATVGAGADRSEAAAPAILQLARRRRIIVVAFGSRSSGIPKSWQATAIRPGINMLSEPPSRSVRYVRDTLRAIRQSGDVIVASLHWGGNWGYDISADQRSLAHALIDDARVDIVFGHSSHHPKAIEVHNGKLILYGCGDLINDYEGISSHDKYRGELSLMYFPSITTACGKLEALEMSAFRVQSMKLERAKDAEVLWLFNKLKYECTGFGTDITLGSDGNAYLRWS